MAVKITTKEIVDYTGLREITIYIEAGQIGHPVLATVETVHYLHPFRLLYLCLLTAVFIRSVPSGQYGS